MTSLSVAIKSGDSHDTSIAEREADQHKGSDGHEDDLRHEAASRKIMPAQNKQLSEGNACHSGELSRSAATVTGAVRVVAELESEYGRAATRNEDRWRATASEEFLQAIHSPPVLTVIKGPNPNVRHHIHSC